MGTALGATTPNAAAPLGVQARAPSATCAAPPRSRPEDCPGKGLPIPPPCKDPCNCVQEILREALNRMLADTPCTQGEKFLGKADLVPKENQRPDAIPTLSEVLELPTPAAKKLSARSQREAPYGKKQFSMEPDEPETYGKARDACAKGIVRARFPTAPRA